jgi:hypothetical protein
MSLGFPPKLNSSKYRSYDLNAWNNSLVKIGSLTSWNLLKGGSWWAHNGSQWSPIKNETLFKFFSWRWIGFGLVLSKVCFCHFSSLPTWEVKQSSMELEKLSKHTAAQSGAYIGAWVSTMDEDITEKIDNFHHEINSVIFSSCPQSRALFSFFLWCCVTFFWSDRRNELFPCRCYLIGEFCWELCHREWVHRANFLEIHFCPERKVLILTKDEIWSNCAVHLSLYRILTSLPTF